METCSSGGGEPITHTCSHYEGLFVISGQATFNADGHQGLVATTDTFVSVHGNTEHSLTTDKADAHMLNFYLPVGVDVYHESVICKVLLGRGLTGLISIS